MRREVWIVDDQRSEEREMVQLFQQSQEEHRKAFAATAELLQGLQRKAETNEWSIRAIGDRADQASQVLHTLEGRVEALHTTVYGGPGGMPSFASQLQLAAARAEELQRWQTWIEGIVEESRKAQDRGIAQMRVALITAIGSGMVALVGLLIALLVKGGAGSVVKIP
jgi:hypothetical protein